MNILGPTIGVVVVSGVVIVLFLVFRAFVLWYWKMDKIVELLQEIVKNTKPGSGSVVGDAVAKQTDMEINRVKVMELFRDKTEIANSDVQGLVGVSEATATRYLEYLEKEGLIMQVGDTGRGVKYIKK